MKVESNRPAICNETASDESFLLGTKSQLTEFAHMILQIVDGPTHSDNWHGVPVRTPKSHPSLTDSICDTVIDGLVMVESELERRTLINKILENCGDTPIDWEGRDKWRAQST